MKHIGWLLATYLLLVVTLLSAQQAEKSDQITGDLTVNVSGLKNNNGKVIIAVSDSKENYETKGAEPFRRVVSTITNLRAEVVFKYLPLGQ